MKTVYFVRHGQSHGNASFFHQQTGDTTLTPYGITQAKEVAHHMKKLPLETIVSSTFSRARSTAEELGRETGLSVEHSDLFVERRRPGVQLRKKKVLPPGTGCNFSLLCLEDAPDTAIRTKNLQRSCYHVCMCQVARRYVLPVTPSPTIMHAYRARMKVLWVTTAMTDSGRVRRYASAACARDNNSSADSSSEWRYPARLPNTTS